MYVSPFRTGRWLAPARRSLVYTRVYRILLSPRCTIELVYYCKLEPRVRVCVRGSMLNTDYGVPAVPRNARGVLRARAVGHARRGRADTLVSRVRDARKTYCMGQMPSSDAVPSSSGGKRSGRGVARPRRGRAGSGTPAGPAPRRFTQCATNCATDCNSHSIRVHLSRSRSTRAYSTYDSTNWQGLNNWTQCAPCSYSNGPRVN